MIFLVIYKYDKEQSESKYFSFRDWFAFHDITRYFNATQMNEKEFSSRVDFERNDWFVYHRRTISKIIDCFD
jgi:hypothetical protein